MDRRTYTRRLLPLLALVALLCPATAGAATRPVNLSPPTLTGSSATAGYARVGDAPTCAPGTWSGDGITYGYDWEYRWEWGTLADATGPTRTVRPKDLGHQLACRVTATNAGGTRRAVVAVEVLAGPPANTAPPAVAGPARAGMVVTCQGGTWTNSPSGSACTGSATAPRSPPARSSPSPTPTRATG